MQTVHSPLGVVIFESTKPNAVHCTKNAHYITEVLSHAGVPFRLIEATALTDSLNNGIKVLVSAGDAALEADVRKILKGWVESGGQWLSLGGLCGMEEIHGARPVVFGIPSRPLLYPQSSLGEGYLKPTSCHPITGDAPLPLHFYSGVRMEVQSETAQVLATILDSHGRETGAVAMLESECGEGRCVLLAPDSIGAIVRIQQGIPVVIDGVSAPDGSGPIDDGILKCDDGFVLDWHFDREEVPGVDGLKGFLQPIADQWRELVLRAIFHLCEKAEVALPVLWLYPRNLPAMAHLSHDTDGNNLECGERLLEVVAQAEIHSAWCTIPPGYPREFIEKVKAAGHELSVHYNALDRPWSEEEFSSQCRQLRELFGEEPVSNKNHYTRWEGGTEFLDWCKREEIGIEQSHGPSKPGAVGFPFGSAQLHFPLADNGEIHSVLQQPFQSADIFVFSPPEAAPPMLNAVEKHHGILHYVFHPAHIQKEGVADEMLKLVAQAKERGMEWQTARWFNDWERSRRAVEWGEISTDRTPVVVLTRLAEATVLVLGGHEEIEINGEKRTAQTTVRWGCEFSFVTLD